MRRVSQLRGPGPSAAFALVALALFTAGETGALTVETLAVLTGEQDSDWFGGSVHGIGDFNGDGVDDFIVGDPYASGFAGRAYVYFGGGTIGDEADLVLTGVPSERFGDSVSGAGDVNGDGYADIIVGASTTDTTAAPNRSPASAPQEALGNTGTGAAYVFFGGPAADAIADLTFYGEGASDLFGYSVADAGDMNGDGFADVIVGARHNAAGGIDAGRAYVFLGGPSADETADLVFTGASDFDRFGSSVSSAGDMNGDGFSDVIVGAPSSADYDGGALVFFGGPAADDVPDLTLTAQAPDGEFGTSVSGAGDFDGDGFSDVIVGAPYEFPERHAYVFLGGPWPNEDPDLTLQGLGGASETFGVAVAGAGDVNGDGFDDMIVGAAAAPPDLGHAYVFFGGPTLDPFADVALSNDVTDDIFGAAVAGVGDVNGDGVSDLMVGTQYLSSTPGAAVVFSIFLYRVLTPSAGDTWVSGKPATIRWQGKDPADVALSLDGGLNWTTLASDVGGAFDNTLSITAPSLTTEFAKVRVSDGFVIGEPQPANSETNEGVFRIVQPADPPPAAHALSAGLDGEVADDGFGRSVASAGDVNGDGFEDLVVGAPGHDGGGMDAGRASVYFRGPGHDTVADLVFTGSSPGDAFGDAAGAAGDVNADGYGDVIIGAPGSDAGAMDGGAAYIYFGGPGADAVEDLVIVGVDADAQLGVSVGAAGDVNGDGYDDVIVGALELGGGNGRALVFFGGPAVDAIEDLVLVGTAPFDLFGYSVAAAGDVNGDGFDDVVAGAPLDDAAFMDGGRAYVYFGGPTVDDVPDWVLGAASAGSRFGGSVRSAGDVNGDGRDDLLVGAFRSAVGGVNAGRAFLFLGGSGADTAPDLIFESEAAGDLFGASLDGAGDVNRDGYADVVIGAPENDANGPESGRAYVYFGGPGADAQPDVVFTGGAAGDQLGGSVSAAGDGSGDGFSDLVIGARYAEAGGTATGRAYIHDFARYIVLAPTGGATWNVGATETVSWLGAEPAEVWLSVDGGASRTTLASSVGGHAANAMSFLVPHLPTRFAQIGITPVDDAVLGEGRSDSLFTVDASIVLLAFRVEPPSSQGTPTVLAWRTDPGPDALAGYRLDRREASGSWRTLVGLTRESTYEDHDGGGFGTYRLYGVNGLGDELLLGEVASAPAVALSAGPVPYRSGELRIRFATPGGLFGGRESASVTLFDVAGRVVREIARGDYPAGMHAAVWDGRDGSGRPVGPGVYFLRARSAGRDSRMKLVVLQ